MTRRRGTKNPATRRGPIPALVFPQKYNIHRIYNPSRVQEIHKKQPVITPARVGICAVILIVFWILFQYVVLADTMPVPLRILALCFYGIVFLIICFRFKNQ